MAFDDEEVQKEHKSVKKTSGASVLPIIFIGLGLICLFSGFNDLWVVTHAPTEPPRVKLLEILKGGVNDKVRVNVTDFQLCQRYVKSWGRRGSIHEGWVYCTGIVPISADDDPQSANHPHVIFAPTNAWISQYFFDHYRSLASLRGVLEKPERLSAWEQGMIASTYPEIKLADCRILVEEPTPHSEVEAWRSIVFGGMWILLGMTFSAVGRRAISSLK